MKERKERKKEERKKRRKIERDFSHFCMCILSTKLQPELPWEKPFKSGRMTSFLLQHTFPAARRKLYQAIIKREQIITPQGDLLQLFSKRDIEIILK